MKRLLLFVPIIVSFSAVVRGGDHSPSTAVTQNKDWFDGGTIELELMSGVVGAPISGDHISYHYTDSELRLGWMLYSARGSGVFRGNLELLASAAGGGIFEGPGNVFGSLGAILRYNFVQAGARIVPYFQIGAGTFISDISENKAQEDIGDTFEADLKAGAGARFLISRNWSLNSELFFEHISNADTQTRNVGINALGGLVGISRLF
jgi:opacity protein-like surface antigen